MGDLTDLLFLISEAKTINNKLKNKLPPPHISETKLLSSFSQHIASDHINISNKLNSKFNVKVSKTTLINGDLEHNTRTNRFMLYIKLAKLGEIKLVFDSRFNLVEIDRN